MKFDSILRIVAFFVTYSRLFISPHLPTGSVQAFSTEIQQRPGSQCDTREGSPGWHDPGLALHISHGVRP